MPLLFAPHWSPALNTKSVIDWRQGGNPNRGKKKKQTPVDGICVTTEWLCLQNMCHLELLYFFNPWRLPVYICFSLLILFADLHPISIYFFIFYF